MSAQVLSSATRGFNSLFTSSIMSRAFTFISGVVVARTVGRQVLGVGTLQLDELLFLGPLIITRDGLRKVAYRVDSGPNAGFQEQSLVNLCWMTVPVAIGIGCFGAWSLWTQFTSSDPAQLEQARYMRAILLTLFALLLALLQESSFLLAQTQMQQTLRAQSESLATLFKCIVTTVGTVVLGIGIEAFALGNIFYAGTLCVMYWSHFYRNRRDGGTSLFPKRYQNAHGWWDVKIFQDTKEFWWQSIQKWALENGEKVVLVFMGTAEMAGEYVLVSNLGSIVVRLLFQPLEEMSLAAFAKLKAVDQKDQTAESVAEVIRKTFRVLVLGLTLLGLVFACFGPAYSHLLLHLLYGTKWSASGAPTVMAFYCTYILAMALNGVCEAFVQGVSSHQELRSYNYWMLGFSVVFLLGVVNLMQYGAVGMVLANVLKMICRVVVCLFVYARRHGIVLPELLPAGSVMVAFFGAFCVTMYSSMKLYSVNEAGDVSWPTAAMHVGVGVLALAVVGGVSYRAHYRQLRRDVKELFGR